MDDLKKIFEGQEDPEKQKFLKEVFDRGVPFTDDPSHDLLVYSQKRQEAERRLATDVGETLKSNHAAGPADEPIIEKGLMDKLVRFVDKIVR